MLCEKIGLHAFKIKPTQELKPLDHLKRRNFSNWALAKLEENKEFHRKIIFSDEAHFWLNGFVDKQNMRYWSTTNPNVLLETPLHPQKVTVWCGFHAGGVIGPYFFVNENDRHFTVNGERSCDLTPLDFFLWGHIKSLVYANKPATLDDLKDNIQREIANVPVEMCARVVENWVQIIDRCKRARGGHMTDIEFHA